MTIPMQAMQSYTLGVCDVQRQKTQHNRKSRSTENHVGRKRIRQYVDIYAVVDLTVGLQKKV